MSRSNAQIMETLFERFDASIAEAKVSPSEALAVIIVHKSLEGSVDPETLFKRVSSLGFEIVRSGVLKDGPIRKP